MNKFFSGLFVMILMLSGCVVRHKISPASLTFSEDQSEMILSGDKESPMRIYKIDNYQDSLLLRTNSEDVILELQDATMDHFVSRLYHTVRDSMSMGVGIAAPQVGVLKKVIWVQRFDKEGFPFEVYYNPRILSYSDEKQDCREGCLSIPDRLDTTRVRAKTIQIEYDIRGGDSKEETVTDFTAVIFQHEIDHLDGILFLDHLEKEVEKSKH